VSTRDSVLELLRRSEVPLKPNEVATTLGLGYDRTKKAMQRMARAGELTTDGTGHYSARVPHGKQRDTSGPHIRMDREEWENPSPPSRLRRRWEWL
jgi:hypothetical protein